MSSRRRGLMGTEKPEPNGFIEGTFTNGQSAWSVDSAGEVVVTAWKGASTNALRLQIDRTLDINAGDSVRVVVTKISGTLSIAQSCDFNVCNLSVLPNASWSNGTTAVNKTFTASHNPSGTVFYIGNRAGTATVTNYRIKFEIYANGTKVFPIV